MSSVNGLEIDLNFLQFNIGPLTLLLYLQLFSSSYLPHREKITIYNNIPYQVIARPHVDTHLSALKLITGPSNRSGLFVE